MSEPNVSNPNASYDVTTSTTEADAPDMTSLVLSAASLLVISVLALIGNGLVIAVIVRYRKLRTATNVFVGNLAISGFAIGMELAALSANVIHDRNALGVAGCRAWGVLTLMSYDVALFSFALISLSRYFLIGQPQLFGRAFSLRACVFYSAVTWLVGLLLTIGTVTGWSEIVFNPKSKACSYSRLVHSGFHYFYISVSFGVPLITSLVSYSLLYITVRRSARKTRAPPSATTCGPTANDRCAAGGVTVAVSTPRDLKAEANRKKDMKLTRMLITTFMVYLASLGPYAFVNMADREGHLSETTHISVSWLLFSNAAVNPFIYGLMNANFREAYWSLCLKTSRPSLTRHTPNVGQ